MTALGRSVFPGPRRRTRWHQQGRREVSQTFSDIAVGWGWGSRQASTVRLAAPHLELDWPVIVAACDCTHLYDPGKLSMLSADPSVAGLVWTYRGEPRVALRPHQYGYARTAEDRVLAVSCKEPVSDNPLLDHVLSGFFTFRSASLMLQGIDLVVANDQRINNEFYMDVVPNALIASGHRVLVFEVEKYIGWGTPDDLEDYFKWERYFARHRELRPT